PAVWTGAGSRVSCGTADPPGAGAPHKPGGLALPRCAWGGEAGACPCGQRCGGPSADALAPALRPCIRPLRTPCATSPFTATRSAPRGHPWTSMARPGGGRRELCRAPPRPVAAWGGFEPIVGALQVLIPAHLVGGEGREAFLQGGHPREERLHEASQRLHA